MKGTFSGGTAASARATYELVAKDLSLVALLKNPFALTPGFEGPKQPPGNRPVYDEDMQSWTAPFVMATINTRNVHRSNMLMGFPYGRDFVYDDRQGRNIAVDVRGITEALRSIYRADELLRELRGR